MGINLKQKKIKPRKKMSQSLVHQKPNDFKHILRILNTNVDGKRQVHIALSSIKGVGRRFATLICKRARIPITTRAGDLNEEQCNQVQDIIADPMAHGFPRWFLNRQRDFKTGKDFQMASTTLDSTIREDVERMKKIKLHRGLRHYWNLKVRGQMTKCTGRGVARGYDIKKWSAHN